MSKNTVYLKVKNISQNICQIQIPSWEQSENVDLRTLPQRYENIKQNII